MDLSKLNELANRAQEEINSKNKNNGDENQIPIFYPGKDGNVRLKLLFNIKSGILQRKLIRHKGNKVPCFQVYGEDCPICTSIHNAEENLGRECGAFSKYGYQTRGIAYAVITDVGKGMLDGNDRIEKGSLVVFMYPVTLYNKINELILNAGDHLESLVAKNKGNTLEVSRKKNGNGPIEYNINIYPFGNEKIKNTDEEFEDLMNSIPDLNNTIVPYSITEDIRVKATAISETIDAEYMSSKGINPNDPSSVDEPKSQKEDEKKAEDLSSAMNTPTEDNKPTETTQTDSGKPSCFGNHDDNDQKCLLCPWETDCIIM